MKHLAPGVRPLARESIEHRIDSLSEDRWIDYARARQVLERLQWMLRHPRTTRPPGLLIYGDSNIGKSMIVRKFLRSQTDPKAANRIHQQANILAIQMPPSPRERRLYGQLLIALNAHDLPWESLAAIEYRALNMLRQYQPAMIIVDEVHNLLAGTAREQRASLNLLKFLSNDLKCYIVALGTRDALAAIQSDDQIASRLPAVELPRWKQNDDFRGFLAGFERQLPLRNPSGIADSRAMVTLLMDASAGVTGVVSSLLCRAARAAIQTKTECIDESLLRAVTIKSR